MNWILEDRTDKDLRNGQQSYWSKTAVSVGTVVRKGYDLLLPEGSQLSGTLKVIMIGSSDGVWIACSENNPEASRKVHVDTESRHSFDDTGGNRRSDMSDRSYSRQPVSVVSIPVKARAGIRNSVSSLCTTSGVCANVATVLTWLSKVM